MLAPQRYSQASLLHPVYGASARDIRARIGVSRDAKIQEMAEVLDRTRRTMVLHQRGFRGHYLPATKERITPDVHFVTRIVSQDESIELGKGASPHELNLQVNPEIIPEAGCADAIMGIVDCDGSTADVTGCGNRLQLKAGTYVSAQLAVADAPGDVAAQWSFCVPAAPSAEPNPSFWAHGPPEGWLKLPLGASCAGGCVEVAVPYWTLGGA